MAAVRGIFSISDATFLKKNNYWTDLSDVWIDQIPNSGYFGGGDPGPLSTMDKVTYSTDTTKAVPSAALSLARDGLAATGNSTHGYFGGGLDFPIYYSTMDKLTYSNDLISYTPSANLSLARSYLAATGNSTAGYFGGGGSPGSRSTMDKLTYSSDTTTAVPGANFSAPRTNLAATGNSTAGYFGGGSPGPLSTMDKLTYSNDLISYTPSANLSIARSSLAATGNSTHGYFGGGLPSGPMDKVNYSSDTTVAVPSAHLTFDRYRLTATGNSTAGYFGGGNRYPFPSWSIMDKTTYSSDTTEVVLGANLTISRLNLAASSARANALPGTWRRFSDGTATTNPASLPPATPTPQIAGNLPTPDTGYFGGGKDTNIPATLLEYSTMDKVTYSSDTTAAVPSATLSAARYNLAATGSSEAGYFGGGIDGFVGVFYSAFNKITYASDSIQTLPNTTGTLSNKFGSGATGSSTAGYFSGGSDAPGSSFYNSTNKVTYSSDTTMSVPGAGLSSACSNLAATGNSTHGYFGGGRVISSRSTIDKNTYSNDTTAAVPTANLSLARSYLAATGNSTAGYFGGGSPGSRSTMDKVTYSSDTAAAVPSAALSAARYGLSATGNSTAGYFGGGFPGPLSTMDKLTYSNDLISYTPSANLSIARYSLAASSAKANALPQSTYSAPVFV